MRPVTTNWLNNSKNLALFSFRPSLGLSTLSSWRVEGCIPGDKTAQPDDYVASLTAEVNNLWS